MNPGDSVYDASRSEHDGPGWAGATVGFGHDKPTRSPRSQKPIQDIQDIIDKLAAVNQELRRPGPSRSAPGSLGPRSLGAEAAQQLRAVAGTERGRTQQREGADVAGHVRLALQIDAARKRLQIDDPQAGRVGEPQDREGPAARWTRWPICPARTPAPPTAWRRAPSPRMIQKRRLPLSTPCRRTALAAT